MAVKLQCCLHFSQLLSRIFVKLTSCFSLIQLRPKGHKGVIPFGELSMSKHPLESKTKEKPSPHLPAVVRPTGFAILQCCWSVLQLPSCSWVLIDPPSVGLHQTGSKRRNHFSIRSFSHAVNANGPFALLPPPKSFFSACVRFSASSQHEGDSWLVSKVLCVV